MGIFDKIIGRKPAEGESASEKEKKPASVEIERPKKAKVKSEKVVKAVKKEKNIAHQILVEPFITEKSTSLGQFNKYVFRVNQKADKNQIKEAVQDYYGVGVTSVNIIKIHPKKRIHGRTVGWKQGFKKAVVTLREGDAIGVAEGA